MLSAGVEFIKRMTLARASAARENLNSFLNGCVPCTLHDYKQKRDVELALGEVDALCTFIKSLERTPVYATGGNGGVN